MKIETLPRAVQRNIAIGLLVLAVSAVIFGVVNPLLALLGDQGRRRTDAELELARRTSLITQLPVLKELLSRIDGHPLWQRLYSGNGASAELQRDFRTLAEVQGLSLDALQPLENADEGDVASLRLRVSFSTTIDRLGKLLLAMNAAPKLLRFENLYVTSPINQNRDSNPSLVVRGDVVAFSLPAPRP